MKTYSPEQIDRANNADIIEYFKSRGYRCERHNDETHIRGFGGLYVKDSGEYYLFSRELGGKGLLNCLVTVMNMDFRTAIKEVLDGEDPKVTVKPTEEQIKTLDKKSFKLPNSSFGERRDLTEFQLPRKGKDNSRVFAYLCKRGISKDVISKLMKCGKLYQDERGNAVFLHYTFNEPCGAEFHGTSDKCYYIGDKSAPKERAVSVEPYIAELIDKNNADTLVFTGYVTSNEGIIYCHSYDFDKLMSLVTQYKHIPDIEKEMFTTNSRSRLKSFNGVAKGTRNSYFQFDLGDFSQKAYVFESAIDLMSFMTLHPEINNCSYVSMAGLKKLVVEDLLTKFDKVILCVDNDQPGNLFCQDYAGRCLRSTECSNNGVKDYNDLLCKFQSVKKKSELMEKWARQAVLKAQERSVIYEGSKESPKKQKAL